MPSVLYYQQCSLLPMLSSTVSTAAASATRNAWTLNFSSIVRPLSSVLYHPSSIVRRLSSFVYRPSSVVLRISSFVCRPSYIVLRLSSFVYRPSSVVLRQSPKLFVPLRFAIIFYSKILSIEPTHGVPPAPHR